MAHTSSNTKASDDAAPLAAIRAYVERHRAALVEVASLTHPLTKTEFDSSPGFLRQGGRGEQLLIPAVQFQASFPRHEVMMRALRDAGHAQVEGGLKPKLTIKTPKAICSGGRVYCIKLGERDLTVGICSC